MGLFFRPLNKVQKDRNVLRQIDYDLARKNLPGVFSYFVVYLVIDFMLGYPQDYRLLSYSLGLGILAISAARLFFILRFDSIYARGPAMWRDQFMALSLCNAMIWAVIQIVVLEHPQFAHAMVLSLVYTAALTSGISMVFATYSRFTKWYLTIVLVPPGMVLLLRGTILDAILAVGFFVYFIFLLKESNKYHLAFWEKIESQFLLEQKVATLNANKIEVQQRADINENVLHTIMQLLKTPLQGVLGMLSLLSSTKLDPDQKQALELARQSGDALVGLISDLEDYTRIRSGSLQLDNKFFDLRKFSENQMDILGPVAHQQGLELSFLYDIDVPSRVNLDKRHVGQVIQSQVQFALNSAHTGEVVFKVSAMEKGSLGSVLRFCVYFQSLEIDIDELQGRIHSLNNASIQNLDSSLLSLTITTWLVNLMGGDQEFKEPRPGVYSLSAYVPLEASSQQIDTFQPDRSLHNKSLLLAYLPERGAKGLQGECESWGMSVEVIETEEGLRAGLMRHPDFVLFNIPLTEDADQIIRAVSELTEWNLSKTRVIFYGAVKQRAMLQDLFPDIPFLTKPAGRYALHNTLIAMAEEESESPSPIQPHNRRILLAEDNQVNRLVTESILKKLGYDYYTVQDGQGVLDELKNHKYDLVLMDCMMPVMDGIEATRHIRADEKSDEDHQRHLPVIALTAKNADSEERICMAAGMDDFLSKPVTLSDLDSVLRRWLA